LTVVLATIFCRTLIIVVHSLVVVCHYVLPPFFISRNQRVNTL
jgi:hypothetical protein